ncbi:hypothetical protein NDU88_010376 [Pleurodeles waltl]|uniref:Uncharacterized protein n=1 Tax=Pleurodeles waltl TaxID=8319 RepID=A0AAV7PVD3_PLEWA|nr:hypothetical protein NDU88_010376 [Pleurodeles waltl]
MQCFGCASPVAYRITNFQPLSPMECQDSDRPTRSSPCSRSPCQGLSRWSELTTFGPHCSYSHRLRCRSVWPSLVDAISTCLQERASSLQSAAAVNSHSSASLFLLHPSAARTGLASRSHSDPGGSGKPEDAAGHVPAG